MKSKYQIIETYYKTIKVNARTEEKAEKLAKEQAQSMNLSQERSNGNKEVEFFRDVLSENELPWWERFWSIAEKTEVNWYQTMPWYQRKELSKEELFNYAEEMRRALEQIYDIAYEYERKAYEKN